MTRRYTPEAEAWLRANYGSGDVNDTLDAFGDRFGWRPTAQALYQKANVMGLVKRRRSDERGKLVERTVRWSCEPEYDAWMRKNDRGHSIAAVADAFEAEFGFRLTRTQVSQWRARNGVGRRSYRNNAKSVPVGTERDTGKGYVLVKVAEHAGVPMSKDNWRPRHHLAWERANGRPVPAGHEIVHADRDAYNDDPANLVAVEKRLVGIINGNALGYWDAESLSVAVARARLMSRVRELESGSARTCGVCGREFEPTAAQSAYPKPVQTCPECLAAGRKARGRRVAHLPDPAAECAVCGRRFVRSVPRQRRCPECIAKAPKLAVDAHRRRSA